jgi:ribonuclease P protein component
MSSETPQHSISSFTKKEVDKIFKLTGSRIRTEWFDILFAPKSNEYAKILVITSRKVGNSPKRNKLRRRLKSIFFNEKLFNAQYDCIMIAKIGSVNLTFQELKDILISIYKK